MSQFVWMFPGGKLIDNFAEVTLVNNVAKTETITVPAAKIWLVLWGKCLNGDDVTRTVTVRIFNSDDKIIGFMGSKTDLGVGQHAFFPSVASAMANLNTPQMPLCLLKAGDYVQIVFATGGASTGGTGDRALVVLEIDAP